MDQALCSKHGQAERNACSRVRHPRILIFCDWLPPDFGAVGQYALRNAETRARSGDEVTLVGFVRSRPSTTQLRLDGVLRIHRLERRAGTKSVNARRGLWTLQSNLKLLWAARRAFWSCDEVVCSGSPPLLLHFVVPLSRLLSKRVRHRLTDFHPECVTAILGQRPWLAGLQWLTNRVRRQADIVEVLGEDMRRTALMTGIPEDRLVLVRDTSPVDFAHQTRREPPARLSGRAVILYSGNLGFVHDCDTFATGLAAFERQHPGRAGLWLNAEGAQLNYMMERCQTLGATCVLTHPVELEALAGVLLAADIHLITLDDRFVGLVLPSKVYACIASGRPILFIGSADCDVHMLCSNLPKTLYRRVDVGDIMGVVKALASLLLSEGDGND